MELIMIHRENAAGSNPMAEDEYDYSVTPDFLPIVGRIFLTEAMSMIMINQPAGGRYRERQRAAPGASRHDRPAPRRHSITMAAAQRMYRGVSFSIAGDGWIVYRTGIQEAQTEWLDAWGNAWRGVLRTARCRSRHLHVANRWIVPREGER